MKKLILFGLIVLMINLAYGYDNYCDETDERLDYYNLGECFSNEGYPGNDSCLPNGLLRELYCMDANACWFYDVPCPYGCVEGVCAPGPITPPTNVCTDSDGGNNLSAPGTCTDSTGTYVDQCDTGKITEFWCDNAFCVSDSTDCPGDLVCDEETPASCINLSDSEVQCVDHDNGRDYSVRSYTEGPYSPFFGMGNIFGLNPDKCAFTSDSSQDKNIFYDCCKESNVSNRLVESYCTSNGKVKSFPVYCKFGCNNGVCLTEQGTIPESTSICPSGKELKIDLLNERVNGNYDAKCCSPEKCLVAGICVSSNHVYPLNNLQCSNGDWQETDGSCLDTDVDDDYPNGNNFYRKGRSLDLDDLSNLIVDCCLDALDGIECVDEGDFLKEALCVNNAPLGIIHECECFNGACLVEDPPDDPPVIVDLDYPCVDTDQGRNYYVSGEVSYLNAETDYNVRTDRDECVDDMNLFNLKEYFCEQRNDGLYPNSTFFQCPNGCEDNACALPSDIPDNFDDVEITEEQRQAGGCCTNPLNSQAACEYASAEVCCPDNELSYISENEGLYTDHPGPESFEECVWEYHYPFPDFSACLRLPQPKADLCAQNGCCCVIDQDGQFVRPSPSKKISCWGDGKFFVDTTSCMASVCQTNYEAGTYDVVNEATVPPRSGDNSDLVENIPENRAFGCCCQIRKENVEIYDNDVERIDWAGGSITQKHLCVGEELYWITDPYHGCTPAECITSYENNQYEKVNPLVEIGGEGCGEGGECDYNLFCKQDYLMESSICCADSQCAAPHDCVDNEQVVNLGESIFVCQEGRWHSLRGFERSKYNYEQTKQCPGTCRTSGFLWWRTWGDSSWDGRNRCNTGEEFLGPCLTDKFWSTGKKACCAETYE